MTVAGSYIFKISFQIDKKQRDDMIEKRLMIEKEIINRRHQMELKLLKPHMVNMSKEIENNSKGSGAVTSALLPYITNSRPYYKDSHRRNKRLSNYVDPTSLPYYKISGIANPKVFRSQARKLKSAFDKRRADILEQMSDPKFTDIHNAYEAKADGMGLDNSYKKTTSLLNQHKYNKLRESLDKPKDKEVKKYYKDVGLISKTLHKSAKNNSLLGAGFGNPLSQMTKGGGVGTSSRLSVFGAGSLVALGTAFATKLVFGGSPAEGLEKIRSTNDYLFNLASMDPKDFKENLKIDTLGQRMGFKKGELGSIVYNSKKNPAGQGLLSNFIEDMKKKKNLTPFDLQMRADIAGIDYESAKKIYDYYMFNENSKTDSYQINKQVNKDIKNSNFNTKEIMKTKYDLNRADSNTNLDDSFNAVVNAHGKDIASTQYKYYMENQERIHQDIKNLDLRLSSDEKKNFVINFWNKAFDIIRESSGIGSPFLATSMLKDEVKAKKISDNQQVK